MKPKHLLIAIASIFAVACQDNRDVVINEAPEQERSHFEQAMQDVMAIVAETNPEKYQHLISIRSTLRPEYYTSATMAECLPASVLKKASSDGSANGLDTLLYIVNFGNDEGFAIMSANPEILGDMVLAVADSGSIYMDDFVAAAQEDNSTNNTPARTVAGIINKGLTDLTNLKVSDPLPAFPEHCIYKRYGAWTEKKKLSPLVPIKIGQGSPYNKYCFTRNGQQAVAGCVAIAVVGIMAANKYPTHIDNIYIDWTAIRNGYKTNPTQQDIFALIIAAVGKQCKMTYGTKKSSASITDAKGCFENYPGYHDLTILSGDKASMEKIESMLLNELPVYFQAWDGTDGHAWVIDGWLWQERCVEIYDNSTLIDTGKESRKLVHCAYGWGGKCDGYYNFKVFNVEKGPLTTESGENGGTNPYNFDNLYKMITYTL